jgi:carbamate kinase
VATFVVVMSGGGGILVCGGVGVEGVVDKDLASSLLAIELGADFFMALTDVDGVYLNYRRPNQRRLEVVTARESEKYLSEGHFPPGSMGPKVQAFINFVRRRGKGRL